MKRNRRALVLCCVTAATLWSGFALADDLLERASSLVAEGQYLEARKVLDPLLKREPNEPRVRLIHGILLVREGEVAEAITIFEGIRDDHPDMFEPHNNLAVLYADRGQLDAARESLIAALERKPDAVAYANLGDVYTRLAAQAYENSREISLKDGVGSKRDDTDNAMAVIPARPAETSSAMQATESRKRAPVESLRYSAAMAAKGWREGSMIMPFTVPEASGGDGTLSYTAAGLPAGVRMSAVRVVSGTPTTPGTGAATVTARDSDGDTVTLTFDWTVASDKVPIYTATVTDQAWTGGLGIVPFTVPEATGGDGALNYIATGLPAGVRMSAGRAVSGTPSTPGTGTTTVTARDADGDTATLTFGWAVASDKVPSYTTVVTDKAWVEDSEIVSFTVPEAIGGDGPLSYSAAGLPAGVRMSAARVVSGIPPIPGSGTATVAARDIDGDMTMLTFDWTVAASEVPKKPESATASEPVPATAVSEACVHAGKFKDRASAGKAAAWMRSQGAGAVDMRRDKHQEVTRHQVYLPGFSTRAEAVAKLRELRNRGIRDVALIGKGTGTKGISLGVYRIKNNMIRRVAKLKELGYPVLTMPDVKSWSEYVLEARVDDARSALDRDWKSKFPGHPIRYTDCASPN